MTLGCQRPDMGQGHCALCGERLYYQDRTVFTDSLRAPCRRKHALTPFVRIKIPKITSFPRVALGGPSPTMWPTPPPKTTTAPAEAEAVTTEREPRS